MSEASAVAYPASRDAVFLPLPRLRHIVTGVSLLLSLLQLYGGVAGGVAAAGALIIAAFIGWRADVRYLGAALIISFPSFGIADGSPLGLLQLTEVISSTQIAGVAVGAPLVLMLSAGARTLYELLRPRPHTIGWPQRWPVLLFIVALVFAALGALYGRSLGLNRWSEGFRSVLAVGGFFWGFTLTRSAGFSANQTARQASRIAVVGCALFTLTMLQGHFVFLLGGLAVGMLPQFVRRRVIAAALAVWVCISALLAGTLTTAAIVLVAGGSVLLAALPVAVLRRWLVTVAVVATLVFSLGAVWAVLVYGEKVAAELTLEVSQQEGFASYAMFKLMGDRGPLWLAAMQQISDGPHVVTPSGRPLLPLFGWTAGKVWEFGPHNSVLQVLRNVGVVGGGALFILMGYFLISGARSLERGTTATVRALAAAFIGIGVSGITTGDFPVSDVGFFVWVIGGLAVGMQTGAPSLKDDQLLGAREAAGSSVIKGT